MSVITYAKCKLLYHVGLMVTLFGGGVYFLTFYQSFNTVDIHLKMIPLDLKDYVLSIAKQCARS